MLESGEGGWIGWGWIADSYKKQRQALLLFPWTSITAMCVMVKGTPLKWGGDLLGAESRWALFQMKSSRDCCPVTSPAGFLNEKLMTCSWCCENPSWGACFLFPQGCCCPGCSSCLTGAVRGQGQCWTKCAISDLPFVTRLTWLRCALSFCLRVLSYKKAVESLFPWFSFSYVDGSPEGSHCFYVVWGWLH